MVSQYVNQIRDKDKLTFRSVPCALGDLARDLEEHRDTAKKQAQSTPEVFNNKILHEAMVQPSSQNAIHMFDQCEITLVQGILLGLMAIIERHLLTVINESCMKESELSFQHGLVGNVFAKRWSQCAHEVGRQLHHQAHHEQTLRPDTPGQRKGIYSHIEHRFRQVRIQLCQTARESRHVDRDQLVGVLDAIIQRGNRIERHIRQILIMDIVREAFPVAEGEFALVI